MLQFLRTSVLFFALIPGFLIAQTNFTISGTANGAESKTIEVITYDDLISFKEKISAKTIIKNDGSFILNLSLDECIYAYLSIENCRGEIYLEPNSQIEIQIDSSSILLQADQIHPYKINYDLQFEIIEHNSPGLNLQMRAFNNIFNAFLVDHFDALYGSRNRMLVDSLKSTVEKSFPEIKNKYFSDYIFFKIGSIELLSYTRGYNKFIRKYFADQEILYSHIEYMELFNQVFTKYLLGGSRSYDINDLVKIVNEEKNYFHLLDIMGVDSILRNEVLREMVMLKGLSEIYFNKEFKREAIITMLHDFSVNTKFQEHKKIADNLQTILVKLQTGTKPPPLSFVPYFSFENYKGKYVYVNFFAVDCELCMAELDQMNNLYKKFKDTLEIISVSVDFNKSRFANFVENKKFEWTFLYYENHDKILEDYQVRYLPLFVLIDREGNILSYPAKSPSENIDLKIELLLNKERRKMK